MKLLEFFEEEDGMLSNMRLNATALVFTGIFILLWSVIKSGTVDLGIIGAATTIIGMGIGGKLIQKKTENATGPEVKPV